LSICKNGAVVSINNLSYNFLDTGIVYTTIGVFSGIDVVLRLVSALNTRDTKEVIPEFGSNEPSHGINGPNFTILAEVGFHSDSDMYVIMIIACII